MTQPQHVAAPPRASSEPTRLPAYLRGLTPREVRELIVWSRMCAEDE